jgi:hypothetical protein
MAKTNLRLVAPDSELRTVTMCRRSNRDMGRDREHLTEHEVERLMKAAKGNRHGQRDAAMILIGFRSRLEGVRALRPAVVVDRVRDRHHSRATRQGR